MLVCVRREGRPADKEALMKSERVEQPSLYVLYGRELNVHHLVCLGSFRCVCEAV